MMHPHSALRYIDDTIGYGVFATQPIPIGTIVYVKDILETTIPCDSPLVTDHRYRTIVDKYTYIEPNGDRILSWDIARFVNHSCNCNTLSTGFGFEIAIRDIAEGEEITDDYGMHNCLDLMRCACQSENCRHEVGYGDFSRCTKSWDRSVLPALLLASKVSQPLLSYLDEKTMQNLSYLADNPQDYKSVAALEWHALQKIPQTRANRKQRDAGDAELSDRDSA